MGVDLVWEDERGEVLDEIPYPQMYISTLALTADLTGTICLQFIDHYSNTTFNQRQIPILIEELKALLNRVSDDGVQTHLRRILELAERGQGEAHTYLKFIGD